MEEYDKPLDEKIELLLKGIEVIGQKYHIDNIHYYFNIRLEKPFIYRAMRGEVDPQAMNECNALYRLYFPEGR
jgi:hypothetical protein